MTKTLGLSAAQAKKVEGLMAERKAAMDKLRAAPGDRKSKGPAMKKLRDSFNDKMKKVLSKDQQAKYDKMQAEARARFGGGRGGPGGPGGPGRGGPGKGGPGGA